MHDDYDDELEQLRELTAPRVLRATAVLRAQLEAPGSTAGIIAERAKQGLATRGEGYQGDGGSVQRAKLAWLLGLTRDLSEVEARACAVRYGSRGERVGYEELRRTGDLREGDGDEVVDLHPRDHDGNPLGAEWVKVRGTRERKPSFAEVGAALGLTARQAQRHLEAARSKIEQAIAWRLMMAEQEARG